MCHKDLIHLGMKATLLEENCLYEKSEGQNATATIRNASDIQLSDSFLNICAEILKPLKNIVSNEAHKKHHCHISPG